MSDFGGGGVGEDGGGGGWRSPLFAGRRATDPLKALRVGGSGCAQPGSDATAAAFGAGEDGRDAAAGADSAAALSDGPD